MNRISILLLRSYIGPFVVTFLVAMFILEMQFVWLYLDDLMGKGLGGFVIFKLLVYVSARLVNMALPLAILMSSIMTMGNLAENNELTAMKSSGISLWRILRPLFIFHICLAILAFSFANNIWPIANLKFRTLLSGILDQKPALSLQEGVFYNGIEGISIRIEKKNPNNNEIYDVLIYDHRDRAKGNRTVIRAEKGNMEQTADKRYLVLTLYNGNSYDEQESANPKKQDFPLIKSHFETSQLRLDLSAFAFKSNNEEVYKNSYEMMNVLQLNKTIDSLKAGIDSGLVSTARSSLSQLHFTSSTKTASRIKANVIDAGKNASPEIAPANNMDYRLALTPQQKGQWYNMAIELSRRSKEQAYNRSEDFYGREKYLVRHQIELHRKFFLAVVCIVLFFVGAPLGAIIRKGGLGIPTVIAICLFVMYHLLSITGERLAKSMAVQPWLGAWLSTAFFLPLGIWITAKASKEAVLFDREFYSRIFKSKISFLRRLSSRTV